MLKRQDGFMVDENNACGVMVGAGIGNGRGNRVAGNDAWGVR